MKRKQTECVHKIIKTLNVQKKNIKWYKGTMCTSNTQTQINKIILIFSRKSKSQKFLGRCVAYTKRPQIQEKITMD